MDASAVAKAQAELQQSNKTVVSLLDGLSAKLKAAADAGDQHVREWQLDLREAALSVREESSLAASLVNIASLGNPDVLASAQAALADRQAQSSTLLTRLGDKLKASADLGDLNAREWQLDLREAAFSADEQSRVAAEVARAAQAQAAPAPNFAASPYAAQRPYPASPYAQPSAPYGQPYVSPAGGGGRAQPPTAYDHNQPRQGGGFLGRLMGSGFGQAMAMGAGFAVGEEVVDEIFDDIF